MSTPTILRGVLRIPVIAAPLFIVSNPALVIAQSRAGIVGSFPSLNARTLSQLDEWLAEISEALTEKDSAGNTIRKPFAVNQIVHKTNDRWEEDLALCEKYRVPVIISSLGASEELNQTVQGYGGISLHDVIDIHYAKKAIEKGATGLIPVASGAGGHAGRLSPFALMQEIREWFDGPVALSGAIASGRNILAAEAMGADFAYIGSPFIATLEANTIDDYKSALVSSAAKDIVYTDLFTGIRGNYLAASIRRAGLDPENLPKSDPSKMNWGSGGNTDAKVWRDIWGCGQGVGAVTKVQPAEELVDQLVREYEAAKTDFLKNT